MIIHFIQAIKLALKIGDNLSDPKKREKSFHLAMRKNTKRALDTAEDIFELIDNHLGELPLHIQHKYKKLKRRFNEYD